MKIRSEYFQHIITLMSGSIIAQIVTVMVSPISTRLFTSDQLGIYTLIVSTVTMFGAVLSLRYEMSIVSEKNEKNVYALTVLSAIICTVLSIVIAIGYVLYFWISKNNSINLFLVFLFVLLLNLLTGYINLITSYNNRYKQYNLITSMYMVRTLIQNGGIVFFGLIKGGAVGLIVSQIFGYFFGLKKQSNDLKEKIYELKKIKRYDLVLVAKKHKKQMIWSAPATFANGFSYSIVNFFIEFLYSASTLGIYSISYRVLGLPITMISANVSKVFFEKASKEFQTMGNFRRGYINTLALLVLIAIPILVLLVCFAPSVCRLFFGKEYETAGTFIRILAPMYMIRFVAGGLNCSAIIVDKQHYDFWIQLSLTLVSLCTFMIAKVYNLQIEQFLQMINLSCCFIYIIYIYIFAKCSKGEIR